MRADITIEGRSASIQLLLAALCLLIVGKCGLTFIKGDEITLEVTTDKSTNGGAEGE